MNLLKGIRFFSNSVYTSVRKKFLIVGVIVDE